MTLYIKHDTHQTTQAEHTIRNTHSQVMTACVSQAAHTRVARDFILTFSLVDITARIIFIIIIYTTRNFNLR